MKALYVRPISAEEREQLQAGLKSASGISVRRSQMPLMSADEHLKPREIAQRVGCSDQTVRQVIHAFEDGGCLGIAEKKRGRPEPRRAFGNEAEEYLRQVLRQSPRQYGYESSLWTLELLAKVCYEQGWTSQQVHLDTISETLHRLGIRWQRAKHRINSPDGQYETKKAT
jgi:transposase